MRICYICSEYPPVSHGGIGTMTQMLARFLVRGGYQVRVAGVYGLDAGRVDEDQGVEIYRLRQGPSWLWPVTRYRLFQIVAGWARKREIDLIEAPDYEGWVAGWPALPIPVVVRMHGSSTYFADELRSTIDRTTFSLERAGLRRADFICSVSKYTAERSQSLFRLSSPLVVLYNVVEIPSRLPDWEHRREQVIFSGTLTQKKGVLPLIEAWSSVRRVCSNAELHIFGRDGITQDGQSMKAYLLSRLTPDARQSVHFHGQVTREEVLQALHVARVAVFPSYSEAFAMAPMEAMAQGCPTIYTRRASGPELIENERDGLLVDPSNTAEIVQAVVRLLTDHHFAKRLGEGGYKSIQQRFSASTIMKQNEDFYRSCLRARSNSLHQAT